MHGLTVVYPSRSVSSLLAAPDCSSTSGDSIYRAYPDMYSTSRSFTSHQSFKVLNRPCDSLIASAPIMIFASEYPGIPFCPWLFGNSERGTFLRTSAHDPARFHIRAVPLHRQAYHAPAKHRPVREVRRKEGQRGEVLCPSSRRRTATKA